MSRARPLILLCVLIAAIVGCKGQGGSHDNDPEPLGPLPSYEEVRDVYNARAERLPKLWARIATSVWYTNDEGNPVEEQFEGHLQVLRPGYVSLSFSKVGDEYAALGSNKEHYWWIERRDEPKAAVGTHEKATPQRMRELGVPVYPRDLIELVGVTPIPDTGPPPRRRGRELVIEAPKASSQAGARILVLDPRTFEPRAIELLDAAGNLQIRSDLANYRDVDTPAIGAEPRVAGDVHIELEDAGVRVRIRLSDPEARDRPVMAAFDLDRKLRVYNVPPENKLDLDTAVPGDLDRAAEPQAREAP